ncbi:hypothetical protein CALCODRAFT_486788 [Calocera cornea HHB12733]|uniref:RanBP2-type domain-containing protein n=1 Tax=Calocera cornea HHB12733 TaxID=1353952 RepID=A0A165DIZ1_9BASI|nr:hypothetical protein CALCODRAFT_486788 [Calocera cornea HHB12733]
MDIDPQRSPVAGLSRPAVLQTIDILSTKSPFAAHPDLPPKSSIEGQDIEADLSGNEFTLQPTSRSPSPLPESAQSLGPSYYSPDQTPRNALLDLYKQGKTPQEGLIVVGNHIGEFLASIQGELRIPAMLIVPGPAHSRGQATQLGDQWFLEVPLRARKGLAVSPFPSLRPTAAPKLTATAERDTIILNDDLDDGVSSASGTSTSAPLASSSRISTPKGDLLPPPNAAPKPSGDVLPPKWICEACSYKNPDARAACRGCGAARDGGSTARRRFTRRPSRLGIRSPEDTATPPTPEAEHGQNGLMDEEMRVDSPAGVVPGTDPDLVIYDDPLAGQDHGLIGRRRRNREGAERGEGMTFAKIALEDEISAARKEILVRRASSSPDKYLSSKSWPERKRIAHAHLLAFISDHVGGIPTWQEIPTKLFQNRLRLLNWPAGSAFPGPSTTITIYKRDALHNLCKAIWDGSLEIEPWGEDEHALDYPTLITDTEGVAYNYEAELKGKIVLDLLSPPTSDPIEEPSSPELGTRPVVVEESSDEADGAESEESEEVKDEDYTPPTRRFARRSRATDSSPNEPKIRQIPTPTLRTVTERRYFTVAEMEKGREEIDDLSTDFDLNTAGDYMNAIEWNLLRRMCRLHLSVYLNDDLGYTDFQDVPLKLREKHLRLTGWPAECDLPSGTHPANWKRDWVKKLLLAIWGKTLKLEDWDQGETVQDAPLIVDTLGKEHWYNETADGVLHHRAPRPTPPDRIDKSPSKPGPSGTPRRITVELVDPAPTPSGSVNPWKLQKIRFRRRTPSSPELGESTRLPAVRFASPPPGRASSSSSGVQGKRDDPKTAENPLKRSSDTLTSEVMESKDRLERLLGKRPRVDKT